MQVEFIVAAVFLVIALGLSVYVYFHAKKRGVKNIASKEAWGIKNKKR